jgi:DNA integrity scanning protein DisA with diadenylate cyclase activity
MKIDISSTLVQAAEHAAADYNAALLQGDLENAMADVQKCIFIYGKLAKANPYHPQSFQEKVKSWKKTESVLREQIKNKTSDPGPLPAEDEKKILPDIHDINEQFWHDNLPEPTDIRIPVIDAVFHIALEIAREGREGRHVGTAFVIGDADTVLKFSKQLILNPFQGHKDEDRTITNAEMKECIKELAQLDGAFVVRGDGIIEAAARYITIDTSKVTIPPGLGTRHSSIAAITKETKSIGIIVSQSGGKISLIREGNIFKTIHP